MGIINVSFVPHWLQSKDTSSALVTARKQERSRSRRSVEGGRSRMPITVVIYWTAAVCLIRLVILLSQT